jgi:APA family basic amino acid/polyamine antiporter
MTAPARTASIGLAAATAIVIANMIGTGVFTSTGFQAASLHDPSTILIAWIVGGVLALCGAAAYAELGAMMPEAGGEYIYLREAYHPVVGVMSGWASLLAGFSAPIAGAALMFARYLAAVVPALSSTDAQRAVAIGLVLAMTSLHAIDTAFGARVQTGFTIAKTLLIIVFIGAGFAVGSGDWGHFASRGGGTENVVTPQFAEALMYVSFAYSGWNAAAYIAGDIKDPQRNVPRALLVGTGLVMVLYVLLNVVFLYAVPPAVLAGEGGGGPVVEVGDVAARALFGAGAGSLLSTMIALALVSTVSAMVMAGPRVYAAMAADGALPSVLARRSARGVPYVAVIAQGILAVAIVMIARIPSIIEYVGFTLWVFAALTVAAVFVMRRKRPDAPRPYRTFGYPVTPALFVVLSIWVAYARVTAYLEASLWVIATLVVGALGYLAAGRRPRR